MSEFRIFETEEFGKTLDKIPVPESRFIRRKLDEYVYPQLRVGPFFETNIKKLRGYSPDTWRYRIGRFRMFYTVDMVDRVVFILAVDLRRDAY
ncbi:MAG: type II toxin-antitoxin system RelE family toxin [Candidatus Methylomirabilia bacterium]